MRLAAAVLLAGCAQPVADAGSPLDGLHACPGAGRVIGAFTAQNPTSRTSDSPAAEGFNVWALQINGDVRRLTDDDVHLGAVISPDGRSVYELRSSGRMLGDSMEAPGLVERLDVATGRVARVAELPGILDLSISGDGRWLAAARTVESHPDTGLDVNSVTVFDVASPERATTLPRAADVPTDRYSVVTQVALSPDGARLAYVLAVEVRPQTVVNTLRIRTLATGGDEIVYTAEGTDFLSDVAWSADGSTVLGALRHQEVGDTVESPARFRTVRVDVGSGRTTLEEGLAQNFSPASADANRLLGFVPGANRAERALVAWNRGGGVSRRLQVDQAASQISLASCSYR